MRAMRVVEVVAYTRQLQQQQLGQQQKKETLWYIMCMLPMKRMTHPTPTHPQLIAAMAAWHIYYIGYVSGRWVVLVCEKIGGIEDGMGGRCPKCVGAMKHSKGSTIVFNNSVIETAQSTVGRHIQKERVRERAREHNALLLYIGCERATILRPPATVDVYVGVLCVWSMRYKCV